MRSRACLPDLSTCDPSKASHGGNCLRGVVPTRDRCCAGPESPRGAEGVERPPSRERCAAGRDRPEQGRLKIARAQQRVRDVRRPGVWCRTACARRRAFVGRSFVPRLQEGRFVKDASRVCARARRTLLDCSCVATSARYRKRATGRTVAAALREETSSGPPACCAVSVDSRARLASCWQMFSSASSMRPETEEALTDDVGHPRVEDLAAAVVWLQEASLGVVCGRQDG